MLTTIFASSMVLLLILLLIQFVFMLATIVLSLGFRTVVVVATTKKAPDCHRRLGATHHDRRRSVIISTDSSGGVVGPHAGFASCPSTSARLSISPTYRERDIDDLMAVHLALRQLPVEAIVPLFGDATLAMNFFMAQHYLRLVNRTDDIALVPGAAVAAQPLQNYRFVSTLTTRGWSPSADSFLPVVELPYADKQPASGNELFGNIIDPLSIFQLSCRNMGVQHMIHRLAAAQKEDAVVTLIGLGPHTDLACLMLHLNHSEAALIQHIDQIVLLAGQEAQTPIESRVSVTARDFNVVMDPLAAAILLSFSHQVQLVYMEIGLTLSTTMNPERRILFNPDTMHSNSTLPFFLESKMMARPEEGPFDQYTIAYVLHPEWFTCDQYPAYMIQCSEEEDMGHEQCTASTAQRRRLGFDVSAELTIDTSKQYHGSLVTGNPDGNIVHYHSHPAARVTACTDFASEESFGEFRNFVYQLH
jgi:inosine-uridine nucleoside N-ribohydrolase